MHTSRKMKVVDSNRGAVHLPAIFEAIIENTNDVLLVLDPSHEVIYQNQSAKIFFGSTDQLKSRKFSHWASRESGPHLLELASNSKPDSKFLRKFDSAWIDRPGTYESVSLVRGDGVSVCAELRIQQASIDHENYSIVTIRDRTEKSNVENEVLTKHRELREAFVELEKKNAELTSMQQMLVQAGKMAALGELSAGIAHELNQPLQGIRGYTQELQHWFTKLPEGAREEFAENYLKEIVSSVDKMASIINYLRTFTRKSTEGFDWVDLKTVMTEVFKMMDRQFKQHQITVSISVSDDLPKLYANPVQLEQVFINLATNARDAIESTQRGNGEIKIQMSARQGCLEIVFEDNGVGMSEKNKQKVFNPFFTTKEVGKGMGLGLSLSYGIVSKLHGSMLIQSELGKGTRFIVKVPIDFRDLG